MSDFPVLLRLPCLVVVLVALLRACPGQAQSFDASGLDRPTELGGSWLMKPGDDWPMLSRATMTQAGRAWT